MEGTLRIATWNVAYGLGSTSNARRRAVIDAVDADIWVLTETHDGLGPGDAVDVAHAAQRPMTHDNVVLGSRWVSIWSRWPIAERLELTDPERTAACVIDRGGQPLIVYGTVLPVDERP